LDGKEAIVENTFFKTAVEVPHMAEVYSQWATQGVHVHYVSNSPWQVWPVLSEFFDKAGFPKGSAHLRDVSVKELVLNKAGQHKLEAIPKIFKDFPDRKFILIGDTGELDPEM
jgi:phosphatidate phosphatase APP1